MNTMLIVLFAHWCPKCNMMMPIVDELEVCYKQKMTVLRIDVGNEWERMAEYEAEIVPTFILFRDGTEVLRMSGLISEKKMYERLASVME